MPESVPDQFSQHLLLCMASFTNKTNHQPFRHLFALAIFVVIHKHCLDPLFTGEARFANQSHQMPLENAAVIFQPYCYFPCIAGMVRY